MRLYVLQRSRKHIDGIERKCYPVELYKTRKAANEAAKALNAKARFWYYNVRKQSLKVIERGE